MHPLIAGHPTHVLHHENEGMIEDLNAENVSVRVLPRLLLYYTETRRLGSDCCGVHISRVRNWGNEAGGRLACVKL